MTSGVLNVVTVTPVAYFKILLSYCTNSFFVVVRIARFLLEKWAKWLGMG